MISLTAYLHLETISARCLGSAKTARPINLQMSSKPFGNWGWDEMLVDPYDGRTAIGVEDIWLINALKGHERIETGATRIGYVVPR